jgi:uncharacterized membrane protein (DUF373 family)
VNGGRDMRAFVAHGFTLVEDVVYVGLGILLAVSAVVLLGSTAGTFVHDLFRSALPNAIVGVLDRLLLVLMLVELLYTVQVSFREHTLVPKPFLIVGLVAATRRVLVLTAEFSGQRMSEGDVRVSMIELAVLTAMIVALVASLLMLRRRHPGAVARRD